ncbi:hypothetical protein BTO09_14065 [Gilvibacter sp. SZ-19]|uniref:SixA phosphatase family protein n=1 Tax=unclassified Gilvibacter TaxID=2625242 RepID=UPI000B3CC644|nr:histidine phosphatase family protein [Gilvibacter sp. SZ-19]ARV13394.1 hypothetical protein BTO09_14065 [Gilvibacter sp. SZ-19]
MKTLYLVRHAKSSWEHNLPDRERPLKKRGLNDAEAMALAVSKEIATPQLFISSPANRAHTTFLFFKEAFGVADEKCRVDERLYDFGGQDVMQVIAETPAELDTLMIFGHNHAFTSIVNMLGDKYIDNLPTCGFAAIRFQQNDWDNLSDGKTIMTLFPKEIR